MSKPNYKGKGNPKHNNYRGKGKGRGNRPRPSEEPKDIGKEEGDINNPTYYYESADVLDQVMNFSFNEYGGVPTEIPWTENGAISLPGTSWDNHMVASYWVNPSIPETADSAPTAMDGATTAALRNFLKLSGSNAKTTNYAPQDVSILILALAEIIKLVTFIARAFGIAYLFNYRNRNYPEVLFRAMGIDADDMQRNLADYRVRFNKLLAVASKIPFPADIAIFRKAADLYGSLYLDDDNSALAQTYMLCPASFWMFNETYDANGAGLETFVVVRHNGLVGMNQVLDSLESMISVLLTSTSLNYIYSDVMRCVQKGYITNLLTFNPIPENYYVVPVFNQEVKDWLHNATIVGTPLAAAQQITTGLKYPTLTPNNDVSCMAATNKLLYHPQFKMTTHYGYSGFIDFDHDNVNVEEKVRATRFTQRWTIIKSGSDFYTDELAFNDEYITRVCYYQDATSNNPDQQFSCSFLSAPSTIAAFMHAEDTITKFDWSPLMYRAYTEGGVEKIAVMGDLDYYTLVDYDLAKKIYDYEIIHLLQLG